MLLTYNINKAIQLNTRPDYENTYYETLPVYLMSMCLCFFFSFFKGRFVLEIFTLDCYAKLTKKKTK